MSNHVTKQQQPQTQQQKCCHRLSWQVLLLLILLGFLFQTQRTQQELLQHFRQTTSTSTTTTIRRDASFTHNNGTSTKATVDKNRSDDNDKNNNNKEKINLMDIIAPSVFSLHPETGLIDFPPSVRAVVIDVGARDSDYLRALEQTKDNTTALILVDPLPDSIIPVQARLTQYAMRRQQQQQKATAPGPRRWLDPVYQNQVFALRAALGEKQEPRVHFHVGKGPACGSLLETTSQKSFWCFQSQRSVAAVVLRLEDILRLIPTWIEAIHVKIDAEGADLIVLKGAGDEMVQRLDTVIIECSNDYVDKKAMDEIKTDFVDEMVNGCRASHARQFMEEKHGFEATPLQDVHGYNMLFTHRSTTATGDKRGRQAYLPPLLHFKKLAFSRVYQGILQEQRRQQVATV